MTVTARSVLTLAATITLTFSHALWAGPTAKFETTAGTFIIELNEEKAPITVANFVSYIESGHYNGTIFHRVIPNFMVQGGGFTTSYQQKPSQAPIKNEAANGLRNDFGTIAMARTSNPDSATAQFFINVTDNDFLNYQGEFNPGYAVFGEVTEGMDLLVEVSQRPTGPGGPFRTDVPAAPVIIKKASIVSEATAEE